MKIQDQGLKPTQGMSARGSVCLRNPKLQAVGHYGTPEAREHPSKEETGEPWREGGSAHYSCHRCARGAQSIPAASPWLAASLRLGIMEPDSQQD